jgi:hypothetical protein
MPGRLKVLSSLSRSDSLLCGRTGEQTLRQRLTSPRRPELCERELSPRSLRWITPPGAEPIARRTGVARRDHNRQAAVASQSRLYQRQFLHDSFDFRLALGSASVARGGLGRGDPWGIRRRGAIVEWPDPYRSERENQRGKSKGTGVILFRLFRLFGRPRKVPRQRMTPVPFQGPGYEGSLKGGSGRS